jgi:hypothetical protein
MPKKVLDNSKRVKLRPVTALKEEENSKERGRSSSP